MWVSSNICRYFVESSSVSPNAKVANCVDLETRVQVIVYRRYLAILEDLIEPHYDRQCITGCANSALPNGEDKHG